MKLEDIYPDEDEWERDYAKLCDIIPTLSALKEDFADSAGSLASALERIDDVSLLLRAALCLRQDAPR